MPSNAKAYAREKPRPMPPGTMRGVWLGATRLAGRPIVHAPVTERRLAAGGAWPHPHMHGAGLIPVVGDETPTLVQDGARLKDVEISKGMCPACCAEQEYRRRHGRRRRG